MTQLSTACMVFFLIHYFFLLMVHFVVSSYYVAADIEVQKRCSNTCGLLSSSTGQSCDEISHPAIEFGKTMCDLVEILEASDTALKNMLVAFEHMAYYMKSATYITIVESNQYNTVDSVRTFFRLLAPHWKPVDCSLLKALIDAASCEKAIKRLNEYLSNSHNVVLGEMLPDDNELERLALRTVSQDSTNDDIATAPLQDAIPNATNRSLHAVASTPTTVSKPAADPTPVTCSQPRGNSSAVPVVATVAANELHWGPVRAMKSLLCGIFRVPPFTLQYDKSGQGSVVIQWVTSRKIALHIKSIILDDGDMNLLSQKRITKVQVDTDYTIVIRNQDYWHFNSKVSYTIIHPVYVVQEQ